jgi:hypothetical protein
MELVTHENEWPWCSFEPEWVGENLPLTDVVKNTYGSGRARER